MAAQFVGGEGREILGVALEIAGAGAGRTADRPLAFECVRSLGGFAPAVRRSGLGAVRFHDLRHTYATLMVAAGAHAKYLQAQMGHASIRVTLDLYGHLYPDANRSVLRELDRLIDPPGLEL